MEFKSDIEKLEHLIDMNNFNRLHFFSNGNFISWRDYSKNSRFSSDWQFKFEIINVSIEIYIDNEFWRIVCHRYNPSCFIQVYYKKGNHPTRQTEFIINKDNIDSYKRIYNLIVCEWKTLQDKIDQINLIADSIS